MSKLTRVFQNLFGLLGAESHFEVFGARTLNGTPTFSQDPAAIQSLSAFTNNGWADAVNPTNNAPFLEDMNALHLLMFRQLAYIFQAGIPEWDPSTPYFTGSVVAASGTTQWYGSLVDNNQGNALPNQTNNAYWQYLNPVSESPGMCKDYAGGSVPFGYLLCDGTAYQQSAYPNLYTAIGGNWNTFNGQSAPAGGYFRVPLLQGFTTVGVGGSLNLTLAQAFGEINHTLTTGEMPIHSHGLTDPGHSHVVLRDLTLGTSQAIQANQGFANSFPLNATATATTGITIQNAGGGGAHNNVQPSAGVLKVIKY